MKNRQSRRALLLVFFIFLTVGSALSWWGWNILKDARASASWPRVQGKIAESYVSHRKDSDGGNTYDAKITYEYSIKNSSYKNDTVEFGELSYSNRQQAADIADRYPEGKTVPVYYDPKQPNRAVLEPGVTGSSYLVGGLGVSFIAISLVMLLLSIFTRNTTP